MKLQLKLLEAIKYEGFYDNPDSPNYLNKEDFDTLVNIDPSPTKKYAQWIIRQAVKEQRNPPVGLTNFLKKYDSLKEWKNFPVDKKNIMDFKTMKDFISFMQDSHQMIQQADYNKYKKESIIILETDEVLILHPKTNEAAVFFGTSCDSDDYMWCTANSRQKTHYNLYVSEGDLFIIRYKDKEGLFAKEAYQLYIPDFKNKSPSNHQIIEYNNERNERADLNYLFKFLNEHKGEGKVDYLLSLLEVSFYEKYFLNAVADNDLDKAEYYLERGVDVDTKSGTALVTACLDGNVAMVSLLLEKGAYADIQMYRPLKSLFGLKDYDKAYKIFRLLIEYRGSVGGLELPYIAYQFVYSGSYKIIDYYLTMKDTIKGARELFTKTTLATYLDTAITRNKTEMIEVLKKHGADESFSEQAFIDATEVPPSPSTLKTVIDYLNNGGKVDARNDLAITQATYVYTDDTRMVEVLLRAGADAQAVLSRALYRNIVPLLKLSLKYSPLSPERLGSALAHTVDKEHYEVSEVLLKAGADPNWREGTATYTTLLKENITLFKLLLRYGADPFLYEQSINYLNNDASPKFKSLVLEAIKEYNQSKD